MSSNKLNKIMRTNIKLNPNILSKNTSEIVNTYIEKLYKQRPLVFRNGLKLNESFSVGPLNAVKKKESQNPKPNFVKPLKPKTGNYETQMFKNLMEMKGKEGVLSPKRFFRSPRLKIYKTKRCYSCSSLSNSSMFHGRQGNKIPNNADYNETLLKANAISSRIQKDLMAIDKILKKRLKVKDKERVTPKINVKHIKEEYNKNQMELEKKTSQLNSKKSVIKEKSCKLLDLKECGSNKSSVQNKQETRKDRKLKITPRKCFRLPKNPDLINDPITYMDVLRKSVQNPKNNKEFSKPSIKNSSIEPSATYSLIKIQQFVPTLG